MLQVNTGGAVLPESCVGCVFIALAQETGRALLEIIAARN